MLSMCFRQDEEPCGHLEQLSGILGPEQGSNSAFSESHLGFPVPLAGTSKGMSPVEQSSQNQYLHPPGTFPCACGRPLAPGNHLSSSEKHSSAPTTRVLAHHLLLRWTLIALTISSGQHSKSFIPFIILDVDLERLQLIQAVLTQAGGTFLLMHLFTISDSPWKSCYSCLWFHSVSAEGKCDTGSHKAENILEGFKGVFLVLLKPHNITYFWQQARQTPPKLFLEEKQKSAPLLLLLSFTNKYTTLIFLEWVSAVFKLSLNLYLFSLKTSSFFSPTYDTFDWEFSSS